MMTWIQLTVLSHFIPTVTQVQQRSHLSLLFLPRKYIPSQQPTLLLPREFQFRHPDGRIVRRFALSDPVSRIYEWLKASPIEGKEGLAFELVFMQKNLMGFLRESIEQAGLKNGTVMVEFIDS